MVKIAIDGNIGCGKSFYMKKLEKDGYTIHPEKVDQWAVWLDKFNTDMNRYSLGFQLAILYDQINLPYMSNQLNLYERSPYTLKNVFGDLLYEDHVFDPDEYALHNLYVRQFSWTPDVIIYLYCDPAICFERLQSRSGISGDSQLTLDYLKKLHYKHECVFDQLNCHLPIFKINAQEPSETVYQNLLDVLGKIKERYLSTSHSPSKNPIGS